MEFDKEDYSIKMSLKILISVSLLLYFAFSQPSIVWVKEYDSGFNDYAQSVATNNSSNIIVTGASYNGTDFDCLTIKYTASGDTLWTRRFDSGGSDIAKDVTIDNSGNIIIMGSSRLDAIYDYLIIKYDSLGNLIWTRRYQNGSDNFGMAIDADAEQNIIITGYTDNGNNYDYLTVKYSPSGDTIWSRRYDAFSNDIADDVTVDSDGNVIVTGSSYDSVIPAFTSVTIKYNLSGDTLWTRQYIHWANFDLYAYGLADDSDKNIIVMSICVPMPGHFYVIKYTPTGDTLWQLDDGYYGYIPRDIAVDLSNNIFIAGEQKPSWDSYDFRTGKFSPDGDTVWYIEYQDNHDEQDEFACGVTVDLSGNIIVTGYADNDNDYDYLTVKYTEEGFIQEKLLSVLSGDLRCFPLSPNPFKSQIQIKYSLVKHGCIKINVYDISGRLVRNLLNQNLQEGVRTAVWDGEAEAGRQVPSGVYFVRLETPNKSITKKIIKLK